MDDKIGKLERELVRLKRLETAAEARWLQTRQVRDRQAWRETQMAVSSCRQELMALGMLAQGFKPEDLEGKVK